MKNINTLKCLATIIFLGLFVGVGYSQSINPTDLPIEESGISAQEYTDIINTEVIGLPSTCGPLTLTLTKVYVTTNVPKMKHTFVQKNVPIKNNLNKPVWSLIPYIIIREEDHYENN